MVEMTQSVAISPHQFTSFGALLRYLRERVELSQKELAAHVGYHYSYMCRIEKNQRMPDANTLITRFIPALDLDDEPQWTTRLLELAGIQDGNASAIPAIADLKPASFPPATALPIFDLSASHLPVFLTPVLGRDPDIVSLIELLNRNDVRIATLIGPPGVGKTRLAAHVAAQLAGMFAHGPLFVDLASLTEADDFLPTLAYALGVQEASGTPLTRTVIAALRTRNLLLILDNFEHIVQAAIHLPTLLMGAPNVKVLVTSREALRVSGEHEYPLAPLHIPQYTVSEMVETAEVENLAHSAAIQLFAQRAQAIQPEFKLDPENIFAVAEVCEKLDGLPLAIELAAARIRTLTPQAMLQQLDRRLEWLTRGSRDSARQTLRDTLEWSYNLLTDKERAILRRMSVFVDGCTLRTAETICMADDLPSESILEILINLMDKSLATSSIVNHQTRYHVLETVREFGREKLTQSDELDQTLTRHLIHFAEYAEDSEQHLDGLEQGKWIRFTENEHGNFNAALEFALTNETVLPYGLKIGAAISLFWLERNHFQESEEWLSKLLAKDFAPEHHALRAKMLYRYGAIQARAFNYNQAYKLCKQSIEIARTLDDKRIIATALAYLGEVCTSVQDYAKARTLLNESVAICREADLKNYLAIALIDLGRVFMKQDEIEQAETSGYEALSIAEQVNDTWALSHALLFMGSLQRLKGDHDAAIKFFERSLASVHEIGDRFSEGVAFTNLAILHNLNGNFSNSGRTAEQAFVAFQSIGDEIQRPLPLRMMGYSAIHAGNMVRARALIRESLKGNHAQNDLPGQLACLIAMGLCDLAQNNTERAMTYGVLAEKRIAADSISLLEPDTIALRNLLNAGKDKLDEKSFNQIVERSRKMQVEEMIASELPAFI